MESPSPLHSKDSANFSLEYDCMVGNHSNTFPQIMINDEKKHLFYEIFERKY